jgi:hypothetical protein
MVDSDAKDDAFLVVGEPREYDSASKTELHLFMGPGLILVTMIFGGIHGIGWSLDFPSLTEQFLWRISSIAITGIPLVILVLAIGAIADTQLAMGKHLLDILTVLLVLCFLYPLSRVLLLVVSLTTLRSLPSSAFQTIEWTTFLPHI